MKDVSPAAAYAMLLPDLVQAGRDCGYAVTFHGSFARDLDIIAVPWTEEAMNAEALMLRLLSVAGGTLMDGSTFKGKDADGKDQWETKHGHAPVEKPHGRRAYVVRIGHGPLYLDVSVMPRRVA